MNLLKQVEPLFFAALQASSNGGMHTARRRSPLGMEHRLKRASEPSRAKQGTGTDLSPIRRGRQAR